MGNLNFDATQVAPAAAFDPLPDAWYFMRIIEAEMATGNSEDAGEMLKLRLEIDDSHHPDYANRSVFDRLCINHANQQPREIAQRTLSSIAHAIGKMQISDSEELLGQRLRVKVRAVPARTDQKTGKSYDASNEVKGYKSADGDAPVAPAATAAAAKPAAAAPAKPSWKK